MIATHGGTSQFRKPSPCNSLKNERVHGTRYCAHREAVADLFEYIEEFYRKREVEMPSYAGVNTTAPTSAMCVKLRKNRYVWSPTFIRFTPTCVN